MAIKLHLSKQLLHNATILHLQCIPSDTRTLNITCQFIFSTNLFYLHTTGYFFKPVEPRSNVQGGNKRRSTCFHRYMPKSVLEPDCVCKCDRHMLCLHAVQIYLIMQGSPASNLLVQVAIGLGRLGLV